MATMRRVTSAAECVDEGETMAGIAFRFLVLHAIVLTRLGITSDIRVASDDAQVSRVELVDDFGHTVAAVTLRVGDDGLTTLVGECQLSATLHECPNDMLGAQS